MRISSETYERCAEVDRQIRSECKSENRLRDWTQTETRTEISILVGLVDKELQRAGHRSHNLGSFGHGDCDDCSCPLAKRDRHYREIRVVAVLKQSASSSWAPFGSCR